MIENSLSPILAISVAALISSTLLVPALRKTAFKYSVLDKPNQSHKTHSEPIPYLGGFAIVIPTSVLALSALLFLDIDTSYKYRLIIILIPALLLSLLGLYDDVTNMSAKSRFLLQTLLSCIVAFLLIHLELAVKLFNNPVANYFVTILWLVGITNALNFFDNLDGGAAGVTFISSSTLSILSYTSDQFLICAFASTLAGASLGFLYWNRNPARIYLGDAGALFIGYLLSVSLVQFEPEVDLSFASALVPIFILALPIIDTTVAVTSRWLRGVSIFQGGKDHLSHRLIHLGYPRKVAAILLWGLSSLYSTLTIVLSFSSIFHQALLAFLGILSMGVLVVLFLRVRLVQ